MYHVRYQIGFNVWEYSISYSEEEFEDFLSRLHKLKAEDYFGRYLAESKVHLRTEISSLFFSFTKQEVDEIIDLMANAIFKFTMIKGALSHNN